MELSPEQLNRIVNNYISTLDKVLFITRVT